MNSKAKQIFMLFCGLIWALSTMGATVQEDIFIHFSFLGKAYSIKTKEVSGGYPKSDGNESNFSAIQKAMENNTTKVIHEISAIRTALALSDWYCYQLIRKVAQQLIPKEKDYWGYTYCKWFFLEKAGFNPMLCTIDNKLLLYVESHSNIYNIPIKKTNGQQYVCLNYHDYNFDIPLEKESPNIIQKTYNQNRLDFNYMISNMPEFPAEKYINKTITFKYKGQWEKYELKVCPEVKDYFTNYPVTDYRFQFNIPLSKVTYASIVLPLKKRLEQQPVKYGVAYIMFLVRNAFAYEADSVLYGREKRFSPEETLASEWSDCEDYAGLFFSLVREVYNLPMIAIGYPDHINVAVLLTNPEGKTITHNGAQYTICEPTPQKKVLQLGQQMKKLHKQPFEIVYAYHPPNN